MGKNIIPQRRGKGSSTYRSPSYRHLGAVLHPRILEGDGIVTEILHGPGHTAPLAKVRIGTKEVLMIAPDGLQVGQKVTYGIPNIDRGNTLPLEEIPEGTLIYNIEVSPGDGGKLVRAAGTTAVVVSQGEKTAIQLPSGQFKALDPKCRATIGVIAGAGRAEKPFAKAGARFHAFRSTAKAPFKVRGVAMNPVSHPHGGGSHQHVGRASTVSSNAPPGRKVGRLSPKKRRKR